MTASSRKWLAAAADHGSGASGWVGVSLRQLSDHTALPGGNIMWVEEGRKGGGGGSTGSTGRQSGSSSPS